MISSLSSAFTNLATQSPAIMYNLSHFGEDLNQ